MYNRNIVRTVLALILAAICGQAATTPMILLSDAEADPVRSAITRREAWTQEAARHLRADADRRMKEGPWSVTYERPSGIFLQLQDYYSEAPYWWPDPTDASGPYIRWEGHINPNRFTANRTALNSMSDAVFALGAASYLFDDDRYAQRAARVLNVWFINPKTRMNPDMENAQAVHGLNGGRAAGIVEGRAFLRALQGMEFLVQSGSWDPKDQAAVRKWFEDYLHWLTQSKNGQQEKASGGAHAAWWVAQVAAAATFVGDETSARTALDYYRDHIFPRLTGADLPGQREESRGIPLTSVSNLEAFAIVCRIAEVQGLDLWNLRGKNGINLSMLIDSVQPSLTDPRKSNHDPALETESDSFYFLAFAGMGLKKPEYIAYYQQREHGDKAWPSLVDLLASRWEASGHQTRH